MAEGPSHQVISYAGPAAQKASRVRLITMLVLAVFSIHALAFFILNPLFATPLVQYMAGTLGTPLGPIFRTGARDEHVLVDHIPFAIAVLLIVLLAQWMSLSPKGSWRIGLDNGKPLPLKSAMSAAFIGMLLSIGLLATIMELLDWWVSATTVGGLATPQRFAAVWVVMACVWAFWSIVFYIHTRSLDRYTALRKLVRRLIAGTVLELVIAGPAHAWIVYNRGGTCYCDRGTWTGISFGAITALWLFGPGAFLLFMRERNRREHLI